MVDLTAALKEVGLELQFLNIMGSNKNALRRFYRKLQLTTSIAFIVAFWAHTIQSNGENFVENSYMTVGFFNGIVKLFAFNRLFNNGKINEIITFLHRNEFQPKNNQQEKILIKAIFHCKSLNIFCIFTVSTSIIEMMRILNVYQGDKTLPVEIWMPFVDNFYVLYVFVCYIVAFCSFMNQSFDCWLATFMIQIGAQCDILANQLGEIAYGDDGIRAKKELGDCILHHESILVWSEKVFDTFQVLAFVQFASSTLIFCTTLFLLSKETPSSEVFYHLVIYIFAAFVEITLYCWLGKVVSDKSTQIAYSAYCSGWYEREPNFRKDLIFFIRRAQKPIIMNVGKIFHNDLNTYINILKSSWSYFMMLYRLQD